MHIHNTHAHTHCHTYIQADIAILEGANGFYDGIDGLGEMGSTSEMVKWLAAPVILVLDVSVLLSGSRTDSR
jgi:cobyrinic acid a,c-diamide synthase